MKDNVHGIKGEYRELTPKEIGDFGRWVRSSHNRCDLCGHGLWCAGSPSDAALP
jgi:hypothetical protein